MRRRRDTETGKWMDPWFMKLSPDQKLAWLYLVDNCDNAGVIDLNQDLADFQIGFHVDWELFFDACGKRVHRLKDGKFWIIGFVEFQCRTKLLNPRNGYHKNVITAFSDHGINFLEFGYSVTETPSNKEKEEAPPKTPRRPIDGPLGKGMGKGYTYEGGGIERSDDATVAKREARWHPRFVDLPFSSEKFKKTWSDWVDHRNEIKKKLTKTSVKQQLKKFEEWGEARSIAAIEHTIANGWIGVRESDDERKSPPIGSPENPLL